MMKSARTGLMLIATAAMLAACGGGPREDLGTVAGAVAGGVLGSTIGKGKGNGAAIALGAVVGGLVGNRIGRSLDEADRELAQRAEFDALEENRSGVAEEWRNPRSGHYGRVVPDRPYRVGRRHCRRYTHTVFIDGRRETMRGSACRNGDGTWSQAS